MRLNSPLNIPLSETQRIAPDRSGYYNSGGGIGESWIGVEPVGGALVKRYWITSSRSTAWTVRVNVGTSVASQWNIRRTVAKSQSTRWNIRRIVAQTRAATWNIRALVLLSRPSEWSIGNMLVSQIVSTWHIGGVTRKTQDVRWNVRIWSSVSQTVSWHIYRTVIAQRQTRWNQRAFINRARDIKWNTNAFIGRQRSTAWNIRQFVTDSNDIRWHTYVPVQKSVDVAWNVNILYPVSDSVSSRWNITGWMPQRKTQATSWSVYKTVSASMNTRWNQSGIVNKQQRAEWMNLSYRLIPYNNIEYTKRVLADGPLAYWKLNSNDTLVEETGNYPLQFVGNAPQAAARGLIAGDDTSIHLVDYAGATAGFRFVHPISIYVGSWSVEGWVSLVAGDGGVIVHDSGFELGLENGKVFATIDTTTIESTSSYSADEVLHVVWTYDANESVLNIYINGVLEGSGTVDFTPPSSTNLHIGAHANMFDGNVDEFAFYASALPQAIAEIHYALGAESYDYDDIVLTSRPVGYWKFDEYYTNVTTVSVSLSSETHVNTAIVGSSMQLSAGAFEGTRTGTWAGTSGKEIKGFLATWTESVPTGTSVSVEFSLDGGANYVEVDNETPFIFLDPYLTETNILSRITLRSTDGVATPAISGVTFNYILEEDETLPALIPSEVGRVLTVPTGVEILNRPGPFYSNDSKALRFNGTALSYINMNHAPSTDTWGYELWFKPESTALAAGLLGGTASSFRITWGSSTTVSNRNFTIRLTQEGNTSTSNTTTTSLTLNEWHHVIVIVENLTSTARLTYWIDGKKFTKSIAWRVTRPTNTYLNRRDSNAFFIGEMSNPAIYDRMLSDAEARRHWEAGEYGRYIPVRAEVPATTISSGPVTMYARSWEFVGS